MEGEESQVCTAPGQGGLAQALLHPRLGPPAGRPHDLVAPLCRTFVAMASEAGLWVILCPGPYVGGDLDLGGLPR